MKYVLDSNVALKWVLRENNSDKARQLRIDSQQRIHELLAPDVFPIEVAHALARSERRGIITPAQGPMFLADILASQPQLHPYVPLLWRAYAISSDNERLTDTQLINTFDQYLNQLPRQELVFHRRSRATAYPLP